MKLIFTDQLLRDVEDIRLYIKGAMKATTSDSTYDVLIEIENSLFGIVQKIIGSQDDRQNSPLKRCEEPAGIRKA